MTTTEAEKKTQAPKTALQVRDLMNQCRSKFQAVLPKFLTVDRLLQVTLNAMSRQALLMQCTPESLLKAAMTCAQLGLDLGIGEVHLVPFWNKKIGKYEAQAIPDYRGLIRLARDGGVVKAIKARVVYERDAFEEVDGTFKGQRLEHFPYRGPDGPGEPRLFYAVALLANDDEQWEVMTAAQVDAIRQRSQARDSGPWVSDPERMALKTVIKRLCKLLPPSQKLIEAIAHDTQIETGDVIGELPDEPEPTQIDQARQRIAGRVAKARGGGVKVTDESGAPVGDPDIIESKPAPKSMDDVAGPMPEHLEGAVPEDNRDSYAKGAAAAKEAAPEQKAP